MLCLSTARLWWSVERTASQGARDVLTHVQARLATLDEELDELLRDPRMGAAAGCTEPARQALARASMNSHHVRRFAWLRVGDDLACWPDGPAAAPELPLVADRVLHLGSSRDVRPTLWISRGSGSDPDGPQLVAELDPRVFADWRADAAGGASASRDAAILRTVWLTSTEGLRVARLGSGPRRESGPELLVRGAESGRLGFGVLVAVDQASWDAELVWQSIWAALATLLTLSAVAAFVHLLGVRRSRLVYRLQRASRRRQFEPFVQPIIDLATGRCAGGEILMRWQHPQRGILAPSEFIEEAERTGLIVPMSDTVMARASHRLASLAREHPELYFSFNVTPLQLRQAGFVQRLDELFNDDALPRNKVLLELTEREFVDGDAGQVLQSLHVAGWRMAIDDFGTGHSSLASLEQLAIDRIKIDRAFVRTIDDQTVNRPVLDAIITLAGQLGVPLIAEGVETRSQWDYLAARGVRHAQGFLMARPMPIAAFREWLVERSAELVPSAASADGARPGSPDWAANEAQVRALWHQMRMPGGLDVRDRLYRLKTYRSCFVGREAVDWIVQRQGVSRSAAVQIGRRLLALDLLRHVLSEHDFEDADFFYSLVEPAAAQVATVPDSEALLRALRGQGGLVLRHHGRGLILHRGSARGRDIVDWIVERYAVSRAVASQWAAQLMRLGALRHVYDDRPFRDDRTLYRPA